MSSQSQQHAGDEDPDIVIAMIREVLDLGLGLTTEQAANIERRLKERYGDRRIRVKKKLQLSEARMNGVGLPDSKRALVFQDAMTTMSTDDIAKRHGVTSRTVYRWMKKGNPNTSR